MYKRVICRELGDMALERVAVDEGRRVFYITWPQTGDGIPAGIGPIGFPKDCVFEYVDGIAGRKLNEAEWATLKPLEADR